MVKVNKLSSAEFELLKQLCSSAKPAEQEQLNFLTHKAPGLTFYKKHGIGNMILTPLSINKNKDLLQLLTEITQLPQEDVVSIHFTEYNVGSETTDHRDSNSSNTVLFLLNSATEGGDLRVDGEILDFKEEGSWVIYDGGKLLHGVTEIKEGYRKVLVIWYGNSKPKKTLL